MSYQVKTSTTKSTSSGAPGAAGAASFLEGASYAQQQQMVGAGEPAIYVVKGGDTLSGIAAQLLGSASRWGELWAANKATVKDPNVIHPGQVLVVPGSQGKATGTDGAEAPAPKAGSGIYVVQSGDTLSEIAAKTLGSASRWKELWAANKSKIPNPNVIYAGMTLVVPGGQVQAPPATEKPSQPAAPAAPEAAPPAGDYWLYTVKPMDSLAWIAKALLGDASKWTLIWELNRDVLKDPGMIHPGQTLKIPGKEQAPSQTPQPGPPETVDAGGPGTLDPSKLSPLQKVCYAIYQTKGALIAANANKLGIEEAVLAAVLIAESSGTGYGGDGKLKIRFESHIFEGYTGKWVDDSHASQAVEYASFEKAKTIDEGAAYKSISMGAAQIMGFNHSAVGYSSAKAMFESFQGSEEKQLAGLFDFVAAHPNLVKAAKAHDWDSFAKGYNGPAYKKYGYDTKLASYFAAYQQILKMVG